MRRMRGGRPNPLFFWLIVAFILLGFVFLAVIIFAFFGLIGLAALF